MVDDLLESLMLRTRPELRMMAHAYFKEIVNSKLLLRRQIESKVACVVYLASKK